MKMPHDISSIFANPIMKDHWIKRGIAYIIDTVIIYIITIIIIMVGTMIFIGSVIGGAMSGNPVGGVFSGLLILFVFILIAIIFTIVYWIYFDAKGGTPGKRILRLKPVALDGNMGYVKAAIRNGSKIVGGFIGGMVEGFIGIMFIGLLIEFIIVFLDLYIGITGGGDDPRQKYTDKMAGTTVIRLDIQENVEDMKYISPIPQTTPVSAPTPEPVMEPSAESTSEPAAESTTQPKPESTASTDELEPAPKKEASKIESKPSTEKSVELPASQDEVVKKYSEFFGIDEERAMALYDAGYKQLSDFDDAIAEDLIIVEKINPTIAREIVKKVSS